MLRRTFTVAQANALVPHLAEEFTRTRRLSQELKELRAELASPAALEAGQGLGVLEAKQETLGRIAALEREIKDRLEALVGLGVEVRRVDGLADFPAWVDGQMVYLCWKFGETEIAFYHATTKGYDSRRPLPSEALKSSARELN